jgi:hypothetical protein
LDRALSYKMMTSWLLSGVFHKLSQAQAIDFNGYYIIFR